VGGIRLPIINFNYISICYSKRIEVQIHKTNGYSGLNKPSTIAAGLIVVIAAPIGWKRRRERERGEEIK